MLFQHIVACIETVNKLIRAPIRASNVPIVERDKRRDEKNVQGAYTGISIVSSDNTVWLVASIKQKQSEAIQMVKRKTSDEVYTF